MRLLILGMACLLTAGFANCSAAAEDFGFDPLPVDWEKMSKIEMRDGFVTLYRKNCGGCHGDNLEGATLGPPLLGELRGGDSVAQLEASIRDGAPAAGMPAWGETMKPARIHSLALYIAEQRQGTTILDKKSGIALRLPTEPVTSHEAVFRLETVADGLDPMPFGMAPLPNGGFIVTERMRGLRVVSSDGTLSDLVQGTPPVYDDAGEFLGQVNGVGWMMGVALHPDYRRNGWIYLQHGDRCSDCNAYSRKAGRPVSMNRLVRGRIRDGRWVDEEILWQADIETYTDTTDLAAGGRIAFDEAGYVYLTMGMKGPMDYDGIQDLRYPYGKILRLHDDGRVPDDNPFVGTPGAIGAIWTYGHRSVQGLEYDPVSKSMWSTEMGPRGGDELNRLVAGGNYGWPNFTSGVNYTGAPVKGEKRTGIVVKREDTIFPVLDLVPSPALSSFVFYRGSEFPRWNNQILLGLLRAADLWRLQLDGERIEARETLLEDLARFRDIEQGPNGELYLLLENKAGSRIVRVLPAS